MNRNWWKRLLSQKGQAPENRRRTRLWLEQLEDRCVPSVTGFSQIDETNNNADGVSGTANTDLLRLSDAAYKPVANGGDGLNTPSLTYGAPTFVAGPRLVSNVVSNQADPLFSGTQGSTDINTVDQNGLSDFGYTFGQFIDHDLDLTPTLSGRITAASWTGGVATITVADGLFRAGDKIIVSGMVPTGFNTPTTPTGATDTVLTATLNTDHSTTLTYARATDPGPATTFGTVADTTTKDGSNGFPIPVDPTHTNDPIGVPGAPDTLAFTRSIFDPTTGITTPREQINVSTSFLDLSQVYGSTLTVSDALRTHSGGLLKSSPGADPNNPADDLLPFNSLAYFTQTELDALGMGNDVNLVTNDKLFAAGDPRANETTELTSLQTLFMRNHNAIAAQLATLDPTQFGFTSWTDDNLFNEARKLNIAEYQTIIYTGYLPALMGPDAVPASAYNGYISTADPSISTEFSTVGFRFGHSLLNNTVARDANDGLSLGDIGLAVSFFNPTLLTPGGVSFGISATDIGPVLKGDADNSAQAMDVLAVSSIRNLLFGAGGQGEDLIARDIWRADDHGIGTYNQVRAAFNNPLLNDLPPITDTTLTLTDPTDGTTFVSHGFEQITSDLHVARLLSDAFTGPTRDTFLANGKFAGDINPFIAGLAEDHVPGSDLGPLFHKILVDQFSRLRDGDRFFYLNEMFNAEEQAILDSGNTLGKVITARTGITNLQADVFRFLSQENGLGKGFYTTTSGQTALTGSPTGTKLTDSLYDGLVAALTNPDQPSRLVLVDANGNYLSRNFLKTYSNVKSYLETPDGSMAFKLSQQLLTAEINVLLGKADPTTSIYVPAVAVSGQPISSTLQSSLQTNGVSNPSGIASIQAILNSAIAQLRSGSSDSTFEEALKDCLDAINNNQAIFILK